MLVFNVVKENSKPNSIFSLVIWFSWMLTEFFSFILDIKALLNDTLDIDLFIYFVCNTEFFPSANRFIEQKLWKFSSTTHLLLFAFNYSEKFLRYISCLCIIYPHKLWSIFLISSESFSRMLFISLNASLQWQFYCLLSLIYCLFMLLFIPNFIECVLSCILWFQIKWLSKFFFCSF